VVFDVQIGCVSVALPWGVPPLRRTETKSVCRFGQSKCSAELLRRGVEDTASVMFWYNR
jgi:hypothetical protein